MLHMPTKLRIDDVDIEFGTMAEAVEFFRSVAESKKSGKQAVSRQIRQLPLESENGHVEYDITITPIVPIKFLRLLKTHGKLTGDDLVRDLGLKSKRGAGGILMGITNFLKERHLNPDQVVRKRGEPGNRIWEAGPELDNALQSIDKHS